MAWFQNNFSELFLGWPSTKIAKNDPALLIKMVDRAKNKQEKLCMCSFPAGASQGFLSLLVLHMFSFPAGASQGFLSLLVLHRVFFPCWCFTGFSFPAGASQGFLSLLVRHMFSFSAGASQISCFKILPWQPNKMATFNRHLSSHDTITSTSYLSSGEQSRAIWSSCLKCTHSRQIHILPKVFPVILKNLSAQCSNYHIRFNYRTVRLGFSKLLGKLAVKYVSTC